MTTPARRLMALVVLASMLGGCTGYKRIALGASPPAHNVVAARMQVGQTVRVELRDATVTQITIAAIEQDALVGNKGERIAYAEIISAERKGVDVSNSLWATFGIYMLIGFIAFAVGGGPC